MIRSLGKRVFRIALILCAVAALGVGALAWQLEHAPVALPLLAPRIERALAEIEPGAAAHVGRAELAWVNRRPVVRVLDLRLLDPDGSLIAALPSLSLRPSIRAALRGRVAVAWIGLTGVQLALVRNADGSFALDTGAESTSAPTNETSRLFAHLLAKRTQGGAAGYLSRVDVHDANLFLDDRAADARWRAENAEVVIGLAPRHVTARLKGVLAMESESNAVVRALRLPVAVAADATVNGATVSDARFNLHASDGTFVSPADPEKPLALDALDLQGAYVDGPPTVDVIHLRVAHGASQLEASARIPLGATGTMEADGTLRSFPVDEIVAFWPPTMQRKTRQWVSENVHNGMVPSCQFRFRVPRTRGPGPLAREAVNIGFDFNGMTVGFMKHFEPLTDVRGSATWDPARFVATVESATSAGLELHDGHIDVDLLVHPSQATITARVQGATPDMLAVIDHPPLEIPKKLDISPAEAGGDGDVGLEVHLPLAPGTTSKDVHITANAELRNTSHSDLLFGIAIENGTLHVGVDAGRIAIRGDTDVSGAPLVDGRVHVDFVVEPPGLTRQVKGSIAAEQFLADGVLTFGEGGLRDVVLSTFRTGKTDLSARLARDLDGHCTVSLAGEVLDLEPLLERPDTGPKGEGSKLPRPAWDLDATIDRVLTGRDLELANVQGAVQGIGDQVRALKASGALASGGGFTASFASTDDGSPFEVTADDGGQFLKSLGIDLHVQGGLLKLHGTVRGPEHDRTVEGEMELNDFRVVQAPILAEILNLGSLDGIASVLRREGIGFTHARIPFVWSTAGVELHEARAVGGIGLTGDGAIDQRSGEIDIAGQVIPSYTLNSALGRLPLIGNLLVDGEGQGVFGINYRVGGTRDKPDISVNPLSALAPGILRQMFVDPFTHKPEALKRSPTPQQAE